MLEYMKFFTENWYVITLFVCAIILSVMKIIEFIGYPTEKKIAEIKSRLLIFVTEAEIELGSKTGQLKLSRVYDEFCAKFPYVKKWFTLEQFSALVDEILPIMRDVLNGVEVENDIK